MANLEHEPPKQLVELTISRLNLPLKTTWKGAVQAAAKKIKCKVADYPHSNSRLLLEAIKEAQ